MDFCTARGFVAPAGDRAPAACASHRHGAGARRDFISAAARAARLLALGAVIAAGTAWAASPDSLFLDGASANRSGRFAEAAKLLRAAEAAGHMDPELHFELGWSAMGARQWNECLSRLERYERIAPGRGQTSEFLGRCELGLNRPERAEALFKQALARDPRLAATVNLSLAAIERARGNAQAARERIEAAAGSDAPAGRALRDLAGPPAALIQPDKPLRLSMSFTLGQNDNVIALGNTIPLPTDISGKRAVFARFTAGGSYTRTLAPETSGTVGYALLLDRYDALPSANLNDHFVYADLFHQWSARTGLSLRVSGEFTTLSSHRFRDAIAIRPAVSYRFDERSVTEFAYSQTHNDYKAATAPQFSRDGTARSLGVTHSMRFPGTRWGLAIGASVNRNGAEGNDFSSNGYGASATLRHTFANRIVAAVGVSAGRDEYGNPNSLATGGAGARNDRQDALSAQLTGPIDERLRWFVHAQSLRNSSNIAFYEYKQNSVSAGVGFDF